MIMLEIKRGKEWDFFYLNLLQRFDEHLFVDQTMDLEMMNPFGMYSQVEDPKAQIFPQRRKEKKEMEGSKWEK